LSSLEVSLVERALSPTLCRIRLRQGFGGQERERECTGGLAARRAHNYDLR